jgi:hypothetical protein
VNHIEASLAGCALIEHRYEEKNGKKLFDSLVIWAFDSPMNRLREFVISDDLDGQVYEECGKSTDGFSIAIESLTLIKCGGTSRIQKDSRKSRSLQRIEARRGSKPAVRAMQHASPEVDCAYLNNGWAAKVSGTSISARRISFGLYACSSPHLSHRTAT